MAIAWVIRAVVAVTPTVVRTVASAKLAEEAREVDLPGNLWRRIYDYGKDPLYVSQQLSQETGSVWNVADFTDSFELVLAQVHWARDSGAAAGTDDAITTHHFLKLSGGSPAVANTTTDLPAVDTAFHAFFVSLRPVFDATGGLKQIRWYRAGPTIVPPQAPILIHTTPEPGTGSFSVGCPPQIAMTITEQTSDPHSWGRFYCPVGSPDLAFDIHGRFKQTYIDTFANA
jgi:hypothetical protein